MSAETTVFVRVLKTYEAWVAVSAVTLDEAREKAERLPGVVKVLECGYAGEVVS